MRCASNVHVGRLMAIRVSGFGMFSTFDGVYTLDLEIVEERLYRRGNANIHFDPSLLMWVICDGDMVIGKQGIKKSSPEGEWCDDKKVVSVKESISIVSMLAFPAPVLDYDFYNNNGVSHIPLLKQPGLVMLDVGGGSSNKKERVPAIFHRHPGAKFTILYSHGNGEDIGLLIEESKSMSNNLRANVFVYDYVGYSTSKLEGSAASEQGCIRSITAAYQFLTEDLTIHPRNIILFGVSIGSGPTVDLASRTYCRDSIAGVILQSPILSGGCVIFGPTAGGIARPFDIFTNYSKIGRIRKPIAIMHGTADEVVPLVNGQRLHSLCAKPHKPFWIDGHGHNDLPPALCDKYAANFLGSLETPNTPHDPDIEEVFRKCRAEAKSSVISDGRSGGRSSAECIIS